jgi:hypothetical protein
MIFPRHFDALHIEFFSRQHFAAPRMTNWANPKLAIQRLVNPTTTGTTDLARPALDYQLGPLSQSALTEEIEVELNRIGHEAGEAANYQSDLSHPSCPHSRRVVLNDL